MHLFNYSDKQVLSPAADFSFSSYTLIDEEKHEAENFIMINDNFSQTFAAVSICRSLRIRNSIWSP